MIRFTLRMPPPPTPWIVRPASIAGTVGAVAQTILPIVKKATDPKNIVWRPKISAKAAMVG